MTCCPGLGWVLQVSLTEESGTEYFKKEPQVGAPDPILSDPI